MINKKQAIKILLGIISAVLVLHILILVGIIPYDIAWGGRLQTDGQMYVFEAISIFLNLVLGFALLIKGKLINVSVHPLVINIILWVFLVLFALNTIGNLLAKTYFEKCFALLTLALCILIFITLQKKSST